MAVRPCLVALALVGCAPAAPEPRPFPAGATTDPPLPPGPGSRQAFFASYPEGLLGAAAAACTDPGEAVLPLPDGGLRCEALPTPEVAAALILTYDGSVEDLPRFVLGFRTAPSGAGYLVTAENYIRVPQRDGSIRQVQLEDPQVQQGMLRLLTAAGGTPVAP